MRILVVDPEPAQLETICRGLVVFGHAATPARSVLEAATALAAHGGAAFDLLVMDVPAPDHRATSLLHATRGLAPPLPALLLTGLTDAAGVAALRALARAVLVKPFTPEELDRAARDAVDEGRAASATTDAPH